MRRPSAALSLALGAVACGSTLRTVPTGPHPPNGTEPIIVDYPPPPAQQELIEASPDEPCAWQDGYWSWLGRRWSWEPGRWVIPPADCYYAPPVMVWIPSEGKGELYYLQPRWYPKDAEELTSEQLAVSCKVRSCGEARAPAAAPDE